jgi:hypothetical protein
MRPLIVPELILGLGLIATRVLFGVKAVASRRRLSPKEEPKRLPISCSAWAQLSSNSS